MEAQFLPQRRQSICLIAEYAGIFLKSFFPRASYHRRNREFPSDVVSFKILLPSYWDRIEESLGLLLSSGSCSCLRESTILPVFLFFSFRLPNAL